MNKIKKYTICGSGEYYATENSLETKKFYKSDYQA
jgi:hypothetical protein